MSSPGARQRRRRQQYQSPRSRREIAAAALAVVVIVGGTVVLIWMLRPGGIADRQPKATWLIALALGALAIVWYLILRPSSRIEVDTRIALGGSFALIAALAVIAGVFWPGGFLRHTRTFPFTPTATAPTASTPTTTQPTTATTATTAPAQTTTTSP